MRNLIQINYKPEDEGGGPPAAQENHYETPPPVPEKFLRDGKPDIEALAKGYTELETSYLKKTEDLRAELSEGLKAELDGERFKERPESADKYEIADIDGVDMDALKDHEMVGWWREHAFNNGLNGEQFQEGITKYIDGIVGGLPDLEAEKKALGENADARIEAVNAWAVKTADGEAELNELKKLAQSAAGVALVEKIAGLQKPGEETGDPAPPNPGITLEELKTMQSDPRYWDSSRKDQAFIAKVEAGYQKLYAKK